MNSLCRSVLTYLCPRLSFLLSSFFVIQVHEGSGCRHQGEGGVERHGAPRPHYPCGLLPHEQAARCHSRTLHGSTASRSRVAQRGTTWRFRWIPASEIRIHSQGPARGRRRRRAKREVAISTERKRHGSIKWGIRCAGLPAVSSSLVQACAFSGSFPSIINSAFKIYLF
jgi:hypothetical protein